MILEGSVYNSFMEKGVEIYFVTVSEFKELVETNVEENIKVLVERCIDFRSIN